MRRPAVDRVRTKRRRDRSKYLWLAMLNYRKAASRRHRARRG